MDVDGTVFVVDAFEGVVDLVIQCSYSVQPFFSGEGAQLVVMAQVYCMCVKALKATVGGVHMGNSRCSIVFKFGQR